MRFRCFGEIFHDSFGWQLQANQIAMRIWRAISRPPLQVRQRRGQLAGCLGCLYNYWRNWTGQITFCQEAEFGAVYPTAKSRGQQECESFLPFELPWRLHISRLPRSVWGATEAPCSPHWELLAHATSPASWFLLEPTLLYHHWIAVPEFLLAGLSWPL